MTNKTDERVELITRVTLPTVSFSLKRSHIEWIEREAAKIGHNQRSELMRRLIEKAMKEKDWAA